MAGAPTTEDSIINTILNEGDSGSVEDNTSTDTQGDAGEQGQGGNTSSTPAAQGASVDKAGKQPQQQPAGQQQQQQQQQTTQAPPRHPGDLVDRSGNVLARAGAERRVFEKAERYVRAEYEQQINQLQTQVQAYDRANTAGSQLGLTPQEVATGHQLMAAYKKDPVETIKFLLTQAKAAGHNFDGLGQGLDTAAVRQMMDEYMAPLRADREAQEQQAQLHQEIENTYHTFIGHYPDAVLHEPDIAALLEADPQISPEVAYLKLQSFAYRNQLDWSKPLGPQINARMAQQRGQGGGNQNNGQRGMPQGRTMNGRASAAPGTVAHESTPTRDIVRQAMLAAGYKLN